MFTSKFLHFILMVFSVVLSVDGRDQCIANNACGNIPPIVNPYYNMSCIASRIITWNPTILWNDGSNSTFIGTADQEFNRAELTGADIGKVTDGRFKGSDVALSAFLSDNSYGCESGNGVSQYSGNADLIITRGSCGTNAWRYCTGFVTFQFNPPLTQNPIPLTIGTDSLLFDNCFGSCA